VGDILMKIFDQFKLPEGPCIRREEVMPL
jgi:hypothetical protein